MYSPLLSGVQTLLSAASALEEQQQDSDIWNCFSSPWSDPYEECHHNMYSECLSGPFPLSRSEGLVYSAEEYVTLEARVSQPLCVLKEVGQFRKGLVAASGLTENSLVMEYKVIDYMCTLNCLYVTACSFCLPHSLYFFFFSASGACFIKV